MFVFEPKLDKRKGFDPLYPEDMETIIEYVESQGELNVDYKYLERLWEDFSSIYEAGFLQPNEQFLREFVRWITDQEIDEELVATLRLYEDDEDDDDEEPVEVEPQKVEFHKCYLCGCYPIELTDFNLGDNVSGYAIPTKFDTIYVCRDCYDDALSHDDTINPIPIMRYEENGGR